MDYRLKWQAFKTKGHRPSHPAVSRTTQSCKALGPFSVVPSRELPFALVASRCLFKVVHYSKKILEPYFDSKGRCGSEFFCANKACLRFRLKKCIWLRLVLGISAPCVQKVTAMLTCVTVCVGWFSAQEILYKRVGFCGIVLVSTGNLLKMQDYLTKRKCQWVGLGPLHQTPVPFWPSLIRRFPRHGNMWFFLGGVGLKECTRNRCTSGEKLLSDQDKRGSDNHKPTDLHWLP